MPLDFVRQPAPRRAQDYTAKRGSIEFNIWRAGNPTSFGLSINGLSFGSQAYVRWSDRYRGHIGIVWLRTKANCVSVANEIADLLEKH